MSGELYRKLIEKGYNYREKSGILSEMLHFEIRVILLRNSIIPMVVGIEMINQSKYRIHWAPAFIGLA